MSQERLRSCLPALNTNRRIGTLGVVEDIHGAVELVTRLSSRLAVTLTVVEKLAWVGEWDVVRRLGASRTKLWYIKDGTLRTGHADDLSLNTWIPAATLGDGEDAAERDTNARRLPFSKPREDVVTAVTGRLRALAMYIYPRHCIAG